MEKFISITFPIVILKRGRELNSFASAFHCNGNYIYFFKLT